MADDHAVAQGAQAVLLAEIREQFDGGGVGVPDKGLSGRRVLVGEICPAGVGDGAGLRHLHADMGGVGRRARVPPFVIPGQTLVGIAPGLDDAVARHGNAGAVPVVDKHAGLGLGVPTLWSIRPFTVILVGLV